MMRIPRIPALIVTLSMSPAFALEIPRGASQDSRIRFVNYQPYNITRVVGTLRSSVQVEFAADEEIAHVALGNSVAWEVAPAGNILFLKPRESQPVTNISVVTTRRDGSTRSYQMELTARDGSVEAGQNTYFYVKYRYPGDDAELRRQQAASRALAAQAKDADNVLALHEAYGPETGAILLRDRRHWSRKASTTTARLQRSPLWVTRKCPRSIWRTPMAPKALFRSRSMEIW